VKVEIWVAGRAKAALRSAEGMRKAMFVVCVLFGRWWCCFGWIGLVVCYAVLGSGRVRVETGCLMELGCWRWSGGQLRDAMEGLRQEPRVERHGFKTSLSSSRVHPFIHQAIC
jgi:hypothetical protein